MPTVRTTDLPAFLDQVTQSGKEVNNKLFLGIGGEGKKKFKPFWIKLEPNVSVRRLIDWHVHDASFASKTCMQTDHSWNMNDYLSTTPALKHKTVQHSFQPDRKLEGLRSFLSLSLHAWTVMKGSLPFTLVYIQFSSWRCNGTSQREGRATLWSQCTHTDPNVLEERQDMEEDWERQSP